MKLLGSAAVLIGMFAGFDALAADLGDLRQAAHALRLSGIAEVPAVTEELLRTIVTDGQWFCRSKAGSTSREYAFRLKLSPVRLKAVTPTGPILPTADNPGTFNAVMTPYDSEAYSRYGLWNITANVVSLKWYATWDKDPTRSRSMSRAYLGANKYPGEVEIEPEIIDNLERGIVVVAVRRGNHLGDSLEIKVDTLAQARFSGEIRSIPSHGPVAAGTHAYEYDLVSGTITPIGPAGPSATGMPWHQYAPVQCAKRGASPDPRSDVTPGPG
ncbi:MAG: hypothetical protein IH606_04415 [Burkholderiales bacterium]|nr:hypothetical protein [Burkholderiales bacterium]